MRYLLLFILWLMGAGFSSAHEIRPALLQLEEKNTSVFEVRWKQPVADGRRLALEPELPAECVQRGEETAQIVDAAIIRTWTVVCDMSEGSIAVAGLDRTLTDVFIQVSYLSGDVRSAIIRPGEPGLDLSTTEHNGAVFTYLTLGIEHILSGPDHLLFVAGLLLLARLRQLFYVITAFTLAHSLTLALTTLGWVSLASAPVELMIAVSIVLLAVEAVRAIDGVPSFTAEHPWLVSFGFGLLHGFGFAGALSDIGLPDGAELFALFYFNVGVEIGQLIFVGVLLGLGYVILRLVGERIAAARRLLAYGVGISGAFWVFERVQNLLFV